MKNTALEETKNKTKSLPKYLDDETVFERKGCESCAHLGAIVSLWCTSEEAINARETAIPGVRHCNYWSPNYERLTKEEREAMEEHGYEKH